MDARKNTEGKTKIRVLGALVACATALIFLMNCSRVEARTKSPFNPVGVRTQGMGNAFVAVADDVNSIYWNPAGLARIKDRQIMVTHNDLYGFGLDENYIGYAQHQFGFSWNHMGIGGDSFMFGADWAQDVFTLSYAYQVDPQTYAGISVKYMKQAFQRPASSTIPAGFTGTAQDVNADGSGVDIGILYIVDEATTVGLCVRDLLGTGESQNVTYNEQAGEYKRKDHYEPVYVIGFSRHPSDLSLFSIQVTHSLDEYRVQLGIEYKLQEQIKLRLGLDDEIITAGVGLYHQDWEFDYAFKNKAGQGLDKTQLFGATVRF